jgi:ribosomal protein S18 acetylase RimI-like enzyme
MILQIDYKNETHIHYLKKFAQQSNLPHFRYFQKMSVDDRIKTHMLTLLEMKDEEAVGYAHIDYDVSSNRLFIGLCVLPSYQNKRIGSTLLKTLLEYADIKSLILYLSVDIENEVARNLYEKNGFCLFETRETFQIYIREPK